MNYVEVIIKAESAGTILEIAQKHKILDFRLGIVGENGKQAALSLTTGLSNIL